MTTKRKTLNPDVVLERLAQIAPEMIDTIVKPGPHCVMATTIGQMTLARFGIVADAYPVEVTVCNAAWLNWMAEDYPGGREEQLRRGAYVLSNTPDFKGGSFTTQKIDHPWDGHLVLRVPSRQPLLIDLDLGSFRRPQHDISLPGGMVAPLTRGEVHGRFTDDNGIETAVQYKPLVAPYRDDYQSARDWLERDRFETFVDELEKAIRA